MKSKFASLLLVVFLMVSLFGCAAPATQDVDTTGEQPAAEEGQEQVDTAPQPEASGDLVTLEYYWIGNGDTDQREKVQEAINDYVEPLINVNVNFHIIGWGDWQSKAVTALQAGEPIDIFFTADWSNYMQLATQNLFTPLNDDEGPNGNLLEQYGQGILETLNPAFITGTQVNGVNLAVPTNKELAVPYGFVYNATAAEEIGFTDEEAASVQTMQDLEPWLAKWKEQHPDSYPFLTGEDGWGFEPWVPGFGAGIPANLLTQKIAPDANGVFDETIYFVWETEVQQEQAKLMYDWMQKGYIHPDSALTTYDKNPTMNAGDFFITSMPLKGGNIKSQELINASGNPDLQMKEIYGQPKVIITLHSGGSMLAIPAISDHPVEAMKFINLMHTDPKLVNMMLFGVEGEHWEFEGDGRVNIINSAWYGAHAGAWTIGNTQIQAVSNKEDPEKNAQLIEYANDALPHPSLGFRFDSTPVAAEITAIQAVVDGMNASLSRGALNPDEELPGYINALKNAGLDTVKAELQRQYDAWKAAKAQN